MDKGIRKMNEKILIDGDIIFPAKTPQPKIVRKINARKEKMGKNKNRGQY